MCYGVFLDLIVVEDVKIVLKNEIFWTVFDKNNANIDEKMKKYFFINQLFVIFFQNKFGRFEKMMYFCNRFQELRNTEIREYSSAGSEHLPYKQGVTSSNLVTPTKKRVPHDGTLFLLLSAGVAFREWAIGDLRA